MSDRPDHVPAQGPPDAPNIPRLWRVAGLRHHAIVRATSGAEAIELALADGCIGDWEMPEASLIGDELPEVYRC